jgi:hypothetical protein
MLTGVGTVWDGVDDEDVADETDGATDVMVVDLRFANVPNHLVYLRLLQNWSNSSWVMLSHSLLIGFLISL